MKLMAYYRTCPECGCNLDPGECCDCRAEKNRPPPLHRETASGKIPAMIIDDHAGKRKGARDE